MSTSTSNVLKSLFFVAAMTLLTACGEPKQSIVEANQAAHGSRIASAALLWQGQGFKAGQSEQSFSWASQVLTLACSFDWQDSKDNRHLLVENLLGATGESSQTIFDINATQTGDLVLFSATSHNKPLQTEVGFALGDGRFIHRQTSEEGLVKIDPIPTDAFDFALRIKADLCN